MKLKQYLLKAFLMAVSSSLSLLFFSWLFFVSTLFGFILFCFTCCISFLIVSFCNFLIENVGNKLQLSLFRLKQSEHFCFISPYHYDPIKGKPCKPVSQSCGRLQKIMKRSFCVLDLGIYLRDPFSLASFSHSSLSR